MPAERVPMRIVREILRLRAEGLSDRAIARSTRLARSTVNDYAGRAVAAGLNWPLPEGLTDRALEALLFVRSGPAAGARRKPEPDWASLHRELRRPGVTLMLLWQEYRAGAPEGYGYSRFCELYDEWESRLSPVMRQVHPAGERLFVDYAGQTVDLVDGRTGEVRTAQIFVAVLGASSYTYAEASWTQTLPDWIGAHARALAFFGGVPRQIVPDNLKAAVLRANWHEPGLNPTYQDFASHYGTAILPARPRRPRDKAKVEVGVQVVERWILARLRHQRFFALSELNRAIAMLLGELNGRPMRRLGISRRQLFDEGAFECADSTGRRSPPCRSSPTSTPSGVSAGSRSTITSTSTVTTTRCPIVCCASRLRRASRSAPSSCSTRRIRMRLGRASPVTCWVAPAVATPP